MLVFRHSVSRTRCVWWLYSTLNSLTNFYDNLEYGIFVLHYFLFEGFRDGIHLEWLFKCDNSTYEITFNNTSVLFILMSPNARKIFTFSLFYFIIYTWLFLFTVIISFSTVITFVVIIFVLCKVHIFSI